MDSPHARRRGLSGFASLVGFAVAALSIAPAAAQQVTAGKGSVTIDLGVLNQLGQPVTGGYAPYGQASSYPPAIYGQPAYAPAPYGQPAYAYTGQTSGGLLFPPQQYPVSTLTVQPPAGSAPYVPPSSVASVPAQPVQPAPAPAATETMAPADTASSAGTPPPPPTPTATSVPMAVAPATTGSEATTAAAPAATEATTGTAADTTASAPAEPSASVPAPTPLASTDATGTATSTDATSAPAATAADTGSTAVPAVPAATDTGATAAPAAPAATTADSGAAATGQTQTASIPPATATEGQIRIAFTADSAEIPDADRAQLDALAQKMAGDENLRIQLLAYAAGTPETASRARRMSLSRALAVRSYLIKQGVRSTRMDVRALGNNVEGSPADRVDIIPKAQ